MKKLACLVGAAIAALANPSSAFAEPLTKEAIVTLTKAGLGDEATIAKIKSEGTVFELTTEEMLSLREQGVTSAVIAAMLSNRPTEQAMSLDSPDPSVPHPAGVYLLSGSGDESKMHRIDPTISNQAKTGGILGYALTGGLASASVKVAIQNETASARASASPRFYFFFDAATNSSSNATWASGMNTVVSSPAEFTLIRLNPKQGRREARVGSMNIAGSKSGVMDKDRLPFEHRMLRPGVYQIDIPVPLLPGEYGFIFSLAGTGNAGAMTARIFDFGVEASKTAEPQRMEKARR